MARVAFFEGKFVPLEEAKISVQTHAFLYGTAVFEGIRAYWVEDEEDLLIFRMREHYERLLNSCKILQIKPNYSLDDLCRITIELLAANNDREDVYVRPVFYKSQLGIGVQLAGLADDFVVFSVPMGPYLDLEKGLRVKVTSWRHISDNAIPMRAKVNGAYVNAALAKSDALLDGYDESIFLTADGHVSEGSAENLFIVRRGRVDHAARHRRHPRRDHPGYRHRAGHPGARLTRRRAADRPLRALHRRRGLLRRHRSPSEPDRRDRSPRHRRRPHRAVQPEDPTALL